MYLTFAIPSLTIILNYLTVSTIVAESHDVVLQAKQDPAYNSPKLLNIPGCGNTKDIGGRIVGGNPVNIKQYPWMASIQKLSGSSYIHFCGASVINHWWLLSAAHCLKGHVHSVSRLRALLGSTDWNGDEGHEYKIDKMFIHKKFDPATYANDIALIKLKTPIKFVKSEDYYLINSVCLPTDTAKPPKKASVYGWGRMGQFAETSSTLLKVVLDIYNTKECNDVYEKYVGKFTKQMMCYATAGKDACQGDSGGPLSATEKEKEYQHGIVSFGQGCSLDDHPGIYTNVALYHSWIKSTIETNS